MMTIMVFIMMSPLLTYFALAFAISWGGVLIVVGPGGIPGTSEQTEMLFPFVVLAMLVGPSVAGTMLTGLVYGRAGFRNLLARMTRWRVGARWYAVAPLRRVRAGQRRRQARKSGARGTPLRGSRGPV